MSKPEGMSQERYEFCLELKFALMRTILDFPEEKISAYIDQAIEETKNKNGI